MQVELQQLLVEAKNLAARYYALTGKPLGITGEVAELSAASVLGMQLADAREPGFDAWLERDGQLLRVQIKGRAVSRSDRYRGRCPSIKYGNLFDLVHLVLLDKATYEPLEIWEATEAEVVRRLQEPGGKARTERNSMGLSQFKSIATIIWSADQASPK